MTFNLDPSKFPRQRRPVGGFYWDLAVSQTTGERVTMFIPSLPGPVRELSVRFLALSSASGRVIAHQERQKIRRFHEGQARRAKLAEAARNGSLVQAVQS